MSKVTHEDACNAAQTVRNEFWHDGIDSIGVALKEWGGDWYVKVYASSRELIPRRVDGVFVSVYDG